MITFNEVKCLGIIGSLTYSPDHELMIARIASDEVWTDKNGQTQKRTTWLSVKAWKQSARFLNDNARKGMPCFVDGVIREEKWTDKATGEPRSTLVVQARRFVLLHRAPERSEHVPGTIPVVAADGTDTRGDDGGYDGNAPF